MLFNATMTSHEEGTEAITVKMLSDLSQPKRLLRSLNGNYRESVFLFKY